MKMHVTHILKWQELGLPALDKFVCERACQAFPHVFTCRIASTNEFRIGCLIGHADVVGRQQSINIVPLIGAWDEVCAESLFSVFQFATGFLGAWPSNSLFTETKWRNGFKTPHAISGFKIYLL